MNDAEVEFLDMFRDEANERLDSMVDTLLALEGGSAGPAALDSLFRDVHTIKGGAGMLGLDDAQTLAHAIEDVLESIREAGEFPLRLADPLLRAADALRLHIAGQSEATPDLLEELGASRAGARDGASIVRTARMGEAPAAGGESAAVPVERRGIRVSPQKIDRLLDLVGETVLHQRRLEHVLGGDRIAEDEDVADELDHGERLFDELKVAAVQMRTLPISTITGGLPRAVRDIAAAAGKDVELVVRGESTELDRVILERLSDVGLGYLSLGQPLTTLSGGERQRIKLATHLGEKGGVYVLDEPTSGLHLADVERLLGLLDRLVDSGKSMIVIEHHQAVMAHADWIIDLGPGAGRDGGRIVFEGTPAEIVAAQSTLTGEHLAAYVGG